MKRRELLLGSGALAAATMAPGSFELAKSSPASLLISFPLDGVACHECMELAWGEGINRYGELRLTFEFDRPKYYAYGRPYRGRVQSMTCSIQGDAREVNRAALDFARVIAEIHEGRPSRFEPMS